MRLPALLLILGIAAGASAQDAVQWSGFALLRASNDVDEGALTQRHPISSQLQFGLDWKHSPMLGAHLHVIARNEEGTRRGSVGIPEAYVEVNLHPKVGRVRLRGGAMFLPTSRENVDALWENAYAISSSALNSWFGEEFRPIGIDGSYFGKRFFGGATIFRGNDTFGALPAERGWRMHDHWIVLGEHEPVDEEYFTSISAENDGRLGWSTRGGWNGEHLLVQLTHIDNRSDGEDYGELFNWNTRFDVVSAEYAIGDTTIAAESGWGPTFLIVEGVKYTTDIRASYLLASHRWSRFRGTVRVDEFAVEDAHRIAVTLAAFWTARRGLRLGAEVSSSDGEHRAMIEARYYFAKR